MTRTHRLQYGAERYEKMFRIAGIAPDAQFAAVDYQSLQGLVGAGMGVSLAPRLSLLQHRADVVVRPTSAPGFFRRGQCLDAARGGAVAPRGRPNRRPA